MAFSVSRSPPALTISTNGLNASGGQLSWVSQLVRVNVRTRSGFERREDLGNASAAVIADQVDLIDLQDIEHFFQHFCIGRHGDILIRLDLGVAMRQEIDRDAAANV